MASAKMAILQLFIGINANIIIERSTDITKGFKCYSDGNKSYFIQE